MVNKEIRYPITRRELADIYGVGKNYITLMLERIGIPKYSKILPTDVELIKQRYGQP